MSNSRQVKSSAAIGARTWLRTACIIIVAVLAFGPAVRADVVEQGPKDARPSGLLAGVSKADITPPTGIPQQNWGSQTHIVAKGMDPAGMYVRALVLSDGKQKFALVDLDAISAGGFDEAVARASALTGIPAEHIRLGAAHTHAGPSLSRAKGPVGADLSRYEGMMRSYRAVLADKITGAIVEADAALRPVHVYGAVGTGSINVNRRVRGAGDDKPAAVGLNPEGFVDRGLVVIRIDDARGNPYAVLVNFQCHGTVLTYENQYISPDWIGHMRNTVEDAVSGSTCLFFQGATGNQGPIEGGSGDLNVARRLGTILGHEAAALALRTETVQREPRFEGYVQSTALAAKQPWRVLGPRDGTLKFALKTLDLPPRRYTSEEIAWAARLAQDAAKKMENAKQAGASEWERYQAAARHRRYTDLLKKFESPFDPAPVRHDVAVLRVGETALVLTPGELFAEIGAAVKKQSPFPVTMFCAYGSGEGDGYMPVESEYALGGYEVHNSPYGVGAAEKLIEETAALLRAVR
jgi:hypothetical protein